LSLTQSDQSKTVLESLGEGIVAFGADRVAVVANSYASDLMGWSGRIEGVKAADLLVDMPDVLVWVDRALESGVFVTHRDAMTQAPNAVHRNLRVSTSAIDFGDSSGVVLVVRDVSDVKRMEREIFQADKMTALGRLAASVAHEVRNPLGAVNLQLQLLEEDADGLPDDERVRLLRRLNIANAEIQRLDRIVGNFLRFSRAPKVKFEGLSLNDVVRRVFDLVTPEAREQEVDLHLELAERLPRIEGDEGQLAQAILNMTVNAFHAIRDRGTVTARTALDASGFIRLSLQDDGSGISEVDLDRVFEFYYTTKDEGTGLGLSIAQRIIYEHGGRIDVQSEPGVGSTFSIYLPEMMEESPRG
jgi:two-component system, sporulation sensor kinase E